MFFKQLAMAAILFFKRRWKFFRLTFTAINIPCKFGEDIFANELDMKVYVKMWRMDALTDALTYGRRFIISRPQPSGHWREITVNVETIEDLLYKTNRTKTKCWSTLISASKTFPCFYFVRIHANLNVESNCVKQQSKQSKYPNVV